MCGKPKRRLFGKLVSVYQEREYGDRRWLDTVVVHFPKLCWLGVSGVDLLGWTLLVPFLSQREILSLWVQGEVLSQGWNLKELTQWHHKAWSMRLNLTQHGKCYQFRTLWGSTDWKLFRDSLKGGAWPLLVGDLIRLVESANERDLCVLIDYDLALILFCRVRGDLFFSC